MKTKLEKQLNILRELGANALIENKGITINGDWNKKYSDCHFFVKKITGTLDTSQSQQDKDFLKNVTTIGTLDTYNSQQDKDFLQNVTTIGTLDTHYSQQDKDFLKNAKNEFEPIFIFKDNILAFVLNKNIKKDILIYKIKIVGQFKESWLVVKGNYSAHGETLKKANEDVQFKIVAEKLKKEPIKPDTIITVEYYRIVTGACREGIRLWLTANNIPHTVTGTGDNMRVVEKTPIKAKDLLPILEKSHAWGFERFKSLITF